MREVRAARVVTPGGVVGPGAVTIDGDTIAAVRAVDGDAPDVTLVPGFVDLQVNGAADVDVAHARTEEDWERLDAWLLDHGVTTWCPTLVSAPLDRYAERFERIAVAAARHGARPAVAGIHVEGPFLGGAPGAHRPEALRPIDSAWLADLPDLVRIVTLAPELTGAPEAIADLTARGVLVSLGHSTASFERATEAVDAGARLVTHVCNGMALLHHRAPGLLGAALTDDRLAVSLIADLVHVHPAVVRLVLRAKSPEGVALISDAVAWHRGLDAQPLVDVDGAARRPDGTLAGAVTGLAGSVRNLAHACGVPLVDAVAAATTTPARLLGLADRGAIEPGRRADLVLLDTATSVAGVWVAGERVR